MTLLCLGFVSLNILLTYNVVAYGTILCVFCQLSRCLSSIATSPVNGLLIARGRGVAVRASLRLHCFTGVETAIVVSDAERFVVWMADRRRSSRCTVACCRSAAQEVAVLPVSLRIVCRLTRVSSLSDSYGCSHVTSRVVLVARVCSRARLRHGQARVCVL